MIESTTKLRAQARQIAMMYGKFCKDHYGVPEKFEGDAILMDLLFPWINKSKRTDMEYEGFVAESSFLLRWAQSGCPVFSLSHNIAAQLLLTEASSVQKQFMNFPYDAFVIELPGPDSYIKILDQNNEKLIDVNAIYFSKYRRFLPKINDEPSLKQERYKAAERVIRASINNGTQAAINELQKVPEELFAESYFIKAVNYKDGIGVFNTADEPREDQDIEEWIENPRGISRERSMIGKIDEDAITTSIRLVASLAIYTTNKDKITMKKEVLKDETKVKDGKKVEVVKLSAGTRFYLDSDIKISQELKQSAKDFARRNDSETSQKRWFLTRKETVIGHFKTQRHGKGNMEIKQIFVSPYVRGKGEMGESQKTYKIDK